MPPDTEPPRIRPLEPGDLGPVAADTGSVLDGRYRLRDVVGRGATATVYRATDELLGRTVAVKVFAPHLTDPVMVARQHLEMHVVAGLQHPHLVAVYDARMAGDAEEPADLGYLVLEFMGGPSLGARLHYDLMNPTEVATIGMAIASALAVVHSAGFVHRDIKPGNILLTASGEPKLSDFGIARVLRAERITHSADVLGTAPYLSPEQASGGEISAATDIYALGLVLLECLTGHREFPGSAVEAAVARLFRDPVIPPTLPPPWPELLRAMTSARPETRPTANDVAATLATSRGTNLATAARISQGHHTPKSATAIPGTTDREYVEFTLAETSSEPAAKPVRTPLLAAAVILAVGVAAMIMVFATRNQPNATPDPSAYIPSVNSSAATLGGAVTASQPVLITITAISESAEVTVTQPSQTEQSQSGLVDPSIPPTATQPEVQVPRTTNISDNGNGENGNGNNGNGNNGNNGNGNGNGNGSNARNGNGNNGN